MSEPRRRVLVAGGGVAGLEALYALHALAGDRLALTLVTPHDEFVYRPLAADKPYSVGRVRRVQMTLAAHRAAADLLADSVEAVDPASKVVKTSRGTEVSYDALVLAVGATPVPILSHAITWDDRADADTVGGLLQDIYQGYSHSLAVVIPPGPVWPLRGYELALLIALEARSMAADHETRLVVPVPGPLEVLGPRVVESVSDELQRAGVVVVSAARVQIERDHATTLVLHPSGRRISVERVLALPVLRGRPIAGIPAAEHGFIDVDAYCRVRGLEGVWAAGDATASPLKSGGAATEQAGVAARDIAARAGAAIEARPFDRRRRALLAGLPAGCFLAAQLATDDDQGLTMSLPSTDVPLLTYLERDLSAGWRGKR